MLDDFGLRPRRCGNVWCWLNLGNAALQIELGQSLGWLPSAIFSRLSKGCKWEGVMFLKLESEILVYDTEDKALSDLCLAMEDARG